MTTNTTPTDDRNRLGTIQEWEFATDHNYLSNLNPYNQSVYDALWSLKRHCERLIEAAQAIQKQIKADNYWADCVEEDEPADKVPDKTARGYLNTRAVYEPLLRELKVTFSYTNVHTKLLEVLEQGAVWEIAAERARSKRLPETVTPIVMLAMQVRGKIDLYKERVRKKTNWRYEEATPLVDELDDTIRFLVDMHTEIEHEAGVQLADRLEVLADQLRKQLSFDYSCNLSDLSYDLEFQHLVETLRTGVYELYPHCSIGIASKHITDRLQTHEEEES